MSRQDGSCDRDEEDQVRRVGSPGFSPAALRQYLHRAGWTAEELADQIGLTRQSVSNWLTGRRTPTPEALHHAARVLNVTPADLTPGASATVTLRDLRTRAGLSQTAAAVAAGARQSSLSEIERGRRPLPEALGARLAELYGVSVDELVDASDRALADRRARLAARRAR